MYGQGADAGELRGNHHPPTVIAEVGWGYFIFDLACRVDILRVIPVGEIDDGGHLAIFGVDHRGLCHRIVVLIGQGHIVKTVCDIGESHQQQAVVGGDVEDMVAGIAASDAVDPFAETHQVMEAQALTPEFDTPLQPDHVAQLRRGDTGRDGVCRVAMLVDK